MQAVATVKTMNRRIVTKTQSRPLLWILQKRIILNITPNQGWLCGFLASFLSFGDLWAANFAASQMEISHICVHIFYTEYGNLKDTGLGYTIDMSRQDRWAPARTFRNHCEKVAHTLEVLSSFLSSFTTSRDFQQAHKFIKKHCFVHISKCSNICQQLLTTTNTFFSKLDD